MKVKTDLMIEIFKIMKNKMERDEGRSRSNNRESFE